MESKSCCFLATDKQRPADSATLCLDVSNGFPRNDTVVVNTTSSNQQNTCILDKIPREEIGLDNYIELRNTMFLRVCKIFISLLIINISEGIRLNITGSSFTKNKYSDSHVILAYNNVGPLMCVSDCMLYKECNAVNFNRNKLECELLAVSYPGDSITDMDGSYYTEIGGWKKDKDECTPNPCEVGQQCIPAMYNNHICLEFEAPCDVNPCLYNNGVCRNKVNDYRCICPTGYYGDHCECCTNGKCNYHGYCVVSEYGWYCNCLTGFYGTYCESK
ncbi:unnamed protein product [Mytilus edulis]|uniref:EGF-like domain-containing protein n=1 Tax=Mytilus edulis TaxID=6550 RepID=A0A8S3UQN7_MYTED|nr:unnamed protein product [Mytilus edulis]